MGGFGGGVVSVDEAGRVILDVLSGETASRKRSRFEVEASLLWARCQDPEVVAGRGNLKNGYSRAAGRDASTPR